MKKFLLLFILGTLLIVFSSCGHTPTPVSSLSINVYDKDTGEPLSNVSLSILETNQTMTINGNPSVNSLTQGQHTIYLAKTGYITRGYIFDLNTNLTLNVYLNAVNDIRNYANVSGKVLDKNGAAYTGTFNVYAGDGVTADDTGNITNPQGLFDVASVCGDIAVSIYTKTGDSIDTIKYLKTTLNPCVPITGLALALPTDPINYSGIKPVGDILVVKQNNGYILARQTNNAAVYTFGVALLAGDSISLESTQTNNDTNYFTRVNAGNSGGTVNLKYQTAVPGFTVNNSGANYEFRFNAVGFASYYEVYAVQITGTDAKVPFQAVVLSGTTVMAPKSLFDTGADTTLVYVRAVNLTGFDNNLILNGTQSYQNYSYTEKAQSLNLTASSLRPLNQISMQYMQLITTNVRAKFNLNYLCSE